MLESVESVPLYRVVRIHGSVGWKSCGDVSGVTIGTEEAVSTNAYKMLAKCLERGEGRTCL